MNKNLTDNNIKKALECCSSQPQELCCNCPIDIRAIKGGCITALTTYALDLINRLQAENERLSKITRPLIAEIKAEAYTEFAEGLKAKYCRGYYYLKIRKKEFSNGIDNLVKEMAGEKNVD